MYFIEHRVRLAGKQELLIPDPEFIDAHPYRITDEGVLTFQEAEDVPHLRHSLRGEPLAFGCALTERVEHGAGMPFQRKGLLPDRSKLGHHVFEEHPLAVYAAYGGAFSALAQLFDGLVREKARCIV